MTDCKLPLHIPEPILNHFKCLLLHKKHPIFTGKFIINDQDEKVPEIVWVCKECKND